MHIYSFSHQDPEAVGTVAMGGRVHNAAFFGHTVCVLTSDKYQVFEFDMMKMRRAVSALVRSLHVPFPRPHPP